MASKHIDMTKAKPKPPEDGLSLEVTAPPFPNFPLADPIFGTATFCEPNCLGTARAERRRISLKAADVRRRIQSHRAKASTTDMDDWYDHADHYDVDREALEAWEGHLLSIVQP
jgi:hypothetical protein